MISARKYKRPLPSRRRRFITVLALLAYVASVTGYPLPLPAGPRDTSIPYPCQGHACGCSSAAQCLDACCCFTAAERLAWARKHKATLPTQTIAKLTAEAETDSLPTAEASCCSRKQSHADACKTPVAPLEKSCCETAPRSQDSSDEQQQVDDSSTKWDWINGVQAQKCQGLTTLWIALGANLPLTLESLWDFNWLFVEQLPLSDQTASSVRHEPAVPPPCRNA